MEKQMENNLKMESYQTQSLETMTGGSTLLDDALNMLGDAITHTVDNVAQKVTITGLNAMDSALEKLDSSKQHDSEQAHPRVEEKQKVKEQEEERER